jgi:hypothetical protein
MKWDGRGALYISTLRRQAAVECKYIKDLPLDYGYEI